MEKLCRLHNYTQIASGEGASIFVYIDQSCLAFTSIILTWHPEVAIGIGLADLIKHPTAYSLYFSKTCNRLSRKALTIYYTVIASDNN